MVWILKKRWIISLFIAGLLISGCGSKGDNEQDQEEGVDINQMLTDSNEVKEVELSDMEVLKGFLPTELTGMKLKDSSVELSQIKDIDIIRAEADYVADSGGGSVNVTIIDGVRLDGITRLALTAWTLKEFNRENINGYERSIRYKNFKAMEKYDNNNHDGVFRVYVADRFIVEVEGNMVDMNTIKEAVDKIDVRKLAALAEGS